MFGTLRLHRCTVCDNRREEYQRAYCGLCRGLGLRVGALGRATLSVDALLVALVADGLSSRPAPLEDTRCPLFPLRSRPAWAAEAPPVRLAGAIQVLLADQWLADRAADGGAVAAAARRTAQGQVHVARTELAALGLGLEELEGFEDRQASAEARAGDDLDAAAEPTVRALRAVFQAVADLPGVDERGATPTSRAALGELGAALGRVIYAVDALEDLERDRRRGQFNPLLSSASRGRCRPSERKIDQAITLVEADLEAIERLLKGLPFVRRRRLLRNVLCDELPRRSQRAITAARDALERDRRRQQVASSSWTLRPAVAAAVAFLAVATFVRSAAAAVGRLPGVSFLVALFRRLTAPFTSLEQGRGGGEVPAPGSGAAGSAGEGATPGAGAQTPGAGAQTPGAGAQTPGAGGGEGSGSGSSWVDDLCCFREIGEMIVDLFRGIGQAIRDCGSGWSGCGEVCASCGQSCTACGESCGSSCSDCGGCCDGCSDCGGCCDGCSDCGNCCDGCNDCGNCCDGCNDCGNCCDGCNNGCNC